MRVPANIIETGKYTSGGEFVTQKTQKPYQGYYYIINDRYFAGKEYKSDAEEIIQVKESNTLLYRLATAAFSLASGITSQSLRTPKISSIQPNIEGSSVSVRYFSQQTNVKPILIKEISKETYDSLQGNALYRTTFIGPEQSIDQAEKQMPGLKTFLSV